MKITPVASPHQIADTGAQSNSQVDARQRAIQMLTGSAPSVDQNNVSPEEQAVVQDHSDDQPAAQTLEAAVEKTKEETVEEAPKAEETTPPSSQLALLARKERALRAQQMKADQALKAREEALAKREAELTGKASGTQFNPKEYVSKADLQSRALDVLLENGIDATKIYEQLTTVQNVDPRVSAQLTALQDEIKSIRDAREQDAKRAEENQSAQYKAAVKQIETDVKSLVSDDPQFEMVKATGSIKDVVELIEQTFKDEGYLMTVEDAATQVEEYLIEQAEKLARTKKIQARLAPKPSEVSAKAPVDKQQPSVKPAQQPQKTLTNAISSSRKLSARERALLAFKGELK